MARLLFPVTAVLALATFVSAQSMVSAQSSASIFIVNADPQPFVGSIVGTVRVENLPLDCSLLIVALNRTDPPPRTKSNVQLGQIPKSAASLAHLPISKTALPAYNMPLALRECKCPDDPSYQLPDRSSIIALPLSNAPLKALSPLSVPLPAMYQQKNQGLRLKPQT